MAIHYNIYWPKIDLKVKGSICIMPPKNYKSCNKMEGISNHHENFFVRHIRGKSTDNRKLRKVDKKLFLLRFITDHYSRLGHR